MPRRRRHRRSGPPRCQHCRAEIRFFVGPTRPNYLPFDPRPVDPRTPRSYPVMGRKAWDPNDLIAEIQGQRGCDVPAAVAEVDDIDWHQLHRCWEGLTAWRDEQDGEASK